MASDSSPSRVSRSTWEAQRSAHVARVSEWTDDRVARSNRNIPHPVYDFLFDYYPFRPAHLKRWSPGIDVVLEDAHPDELDWGADFVVCDGGAYIPASTFPEKRRPFLEWAFKYLSIIADRPPQFSCFGLHEWAMVYKTSAPRHSSVPLRLSPGEIEQIVEASDLRCTHFDAFRFFTPEAVPLNRNKLTRETTSNFDQRACIHVTMDLYRFAHKIAPWCSSDLIADTFMLAADARRVDMRASPYDLRDQGFEPILIETAEGRESYIHEQRRLAALAVPLRARLCDVYRRLIHAYDAHALAA